MNLNQKETLEILTVVRSSHHGCSVTKGVLRNFTKFTGKHVCLSPATLLKKRPWHRCFPLNFAKFLRTPFFYRTPTDDCFWGVTNSDDEEESAEYKVKRISNSEWCKTSLWQMFFKLGVRPATLLKRDFNTGVFLWNLRNS